MNSPFIDSKPLPEFSLWNKLKYERRLTSFELEITARCNNNCRHCYINLPADDKKAVNREISFAEIKDIAEQAVDLGALWCLITGGEPLLRKDFSDIYLYLKKKGFLVSVFTNATLITDEQIKLFKEYPPRDIEITVYGITKETYEKVTRSPNSFDCFMRGLNVLLKNDIKVRLKTMGLRSNIQQLPQIAQFCKERTKDYFRFDPFLELRVDRDLNRNKEIISERLSAEEIVAIERADNERFNALEKDCNRLVGLEREHLNCNHLFHCSSGNISFTISYDGLFHLCSPLRHPDCIFNLKDGTLVEAWQDFIPKVRNLRSNRKEFLEKCRRCSIINLCMWCPGRADLETGEMDKPVDYFCEVAHRRAEMLGSAVKH